MLDAGALEDRPHPLSVADGVGWKVEHDGQACLEQRLDVAAYGLAQPPE